MIINNNNKQFKKFLNFNIKDTYKLQFSEIMNSNFSKVCTLQQGLELMKLIEVIKKKPKK